MQREAMLCNASSLYAVILSDRIVHNILVGFPTSGFSSFDGLPRRGAHRAEHARVPPVVHRRDP